MFHPEIKNADRLVVGPYGVAPRRDPRNTTALEIILRPQQECLTVFFRRRIPLGRSVRRVTSSRQSAPPTKTSSGSDGTTFPTSTRCLQRTFSTAMTTKIRRAMRTMTTSFAPAPHPPHPARSAVFPRWHAFPPAPRSVPPRVDPNPARRIRRRTSGSFYSPTGPTTRGGFVVNRLWQVMQSTLVPTLVSIHPQ